MRTFDNSRPALYQPAIDGLRAVAVLLVVGYHAFPSLVTGGFIGVDVFFVISGFLITNILARGCERNDFSWREFYARRIRRIFPALAVVLLSSLAFGYLLLSLHEFRQLAKHVAGGTGFISNFVLWNEAGYFDGSAETKPLLHLWSLGIEEQFYLLWPPFLYLAYKRSKNLFTSILIVAGLSFVYNLGEGGRNEIADFYSPASRFWELAAGGLLACATRGVQNRHARNLASVAGLALIAVAATTFTKHDAYPSWRALVPVAGAFLLLMSGHESWVNRALLSRSAFVRIGLISYPLYLWHWPLLAFLRLDTSGEPSLLMRSAAVAVSFLLAALTYELIEKPVRFGASLKGKVAFLCASMAIIGGVALYAHQSDTASAVLRPPSPTGDPLAWTYWSDRACEAKYGTSPCQTNNETPSIMILGDSHGNHLYPGFAQTEPKTDVISAGTCLPLDGIYLHVKKNQEQNSCNTTNSFQIAQNVLQNNPAIKTVIISFRWRHILTGQIKNPHEHDLWEGVWLSSTVAEDAGLNDAELLDRGLTRALAYLQSQKMNVVLIRPTPELDPELNDACKLALASTASDCLMPAKIYDDERRLEEPMLAKLQSLFPDLLIYDPRNALCDADTCAIVKDGVPLYRDNHHLSLNGSLYLAKDIKSWMSRKGLLN
jgi:peptidoglycan/LPS O-acetylase OafA/YrhL